MTRLYTAKQIAEAKSCRKDSVLERLKKLTPAKLEPHPGQPIRWYAYETLPADMQRALDDFEHRRAHEGAVLPAPTFTAAPEPGIRESFRLLLRAIVRALRGVKP